MAKNKCEAKPCKVKEFVSKNKLAVIIVSILLAVAIITSVTLLVLKNIGVFYSKSITGSWQVISEEDGSDVFYTFDEDGTFVYTVDSVSQYGTWEVNEESKTINCVYGSSDYSLSMDYQVLGGAFKDRNLQLSIADGSVVYTLDQVDSYIVDVEVKDPVYSDELIGEWKNDSFGTTYVFNQDGTFALKELNGKKVTNGEYTIKDDKIIITYVLNNEEMDTQLSFVVKDNTATISGMECSKVTE